MRTVLGVPPISFESVSKDNPKPTHRPTQMRHKRPTG